MAQKRKRQKRLMDNNDGGCLAALGVLVLILIVGVALIPALNFLIKLSPYLIGGAIVVVLIVTIVSNTKDK